MNDTDVAAFWTGLGAPPTAADIADMIPKALRDANAEIARLRDQLAQVDDLRAEIARLAPDNGHAPGTAELLSILDTARHAVADYPITDRCGCGPQGHRVRFHRRGAERCRAES